MKIFVSVHLTNPCQRSKKHEGLKCGGDFTDAGYLAQLLRLRLLPEEYIYPREAIAARGRARKRMQPVRYRTAQILSMENIFARQASARMSGEATGDRLLDRSRSIDFLPDVAPAIIWLSCNSSRGSRCVVNGQRLRG